MTSVVPNGKVRKISNCAGSRVCTKSCPAEVNATAVAGTVLTPPCERAQGFVFMSDVEMSDTDEPPPHATGPPADFALPSPGNTTKGRGALGSGTPACATAIHR